MTYKIWLAFCGTLFLFSPSLYAQDRTIKVQGNASVAAAPDQATFTMGVETRQSSAQQALKENNDLMAKITSALKQEGVGEKDIQTSDFSLRPVYNTPKDGESLNVKAYIVAHRLTVRTYDTAKVGILLDKANQAGANRFEGLTFGVRDDAPLHRKAQAAAVEDARQQAKVYAEAMGVALGRALSLNAGAAYGAPTPLRAMAFMQDVPGVPIQPGELNFNATADVVWEVMDLVK